MVCRSASRMAVLPEQACGVFGASSKLAQFTQAEPRAHRENEGDTRVLAVWAMGELKSGTLPHPASYLHS